jgi:hypothetical protein
VVDGFELDQLDFALTRNTRSHGGSISYQRWAPGIYPQNGRHPFDDAGVRWSGEPPFDPPPLRTVGTYPRVGQPFPDPNHLEPPLTVAEGAVVARPVVGEACGFDALLLVGGDLEPVVQHYREQFDDAVGEEVRVDRFEDHGVEMTRVLASEPGGTDLHLEAVAGGDGQPNWVWLSRCEDF